MQFKVHQILDFERHGAYATIVQFDDLKILLDCGTPRDLSISRYVDYASLLKDVSMILISSADLSHAGALLSLINQFNFYVA